MPRLWTMYRLRLLATVVALILIQGVAAAVAAFATRDLFSALHTGANLPLIAMASLALSGAVIGLTRVSARLRGELIGQSYALDVRTALFDQEAAMARHDVAIRRTGYTSLRFVGDLTAIRNWPSRGLPRLAAAAILLPATLAVLGALNPQFLIGTAPVLMVGLIAITLGGLRLSDRHKRLRLRRGRIAADMAERMPIAPLLYAFGRHATEKDRIVQRSKEMIDAALDRTRLSETLKAVPDLLAGVLALIVIWSGVQTGTSTANIAAGLAAIGIALAPTRDLATVWNHLSAFKVARAKCAAALARPRRGADLCTSDLKAGPVSIRLEDVFAGPIASLSQTVSAGNIVSVEGKTGSGKSLILNILAGFDTTEAGTIRLSGQVIEDIKPGRLRQSVALVTVTPPILKGSLRRALTLGLEKRPSDQDILNAADRFGLGELVNNRGGLDAKIAEAGRDLSDGQRVRVALVRAALGEPGLIMLDSIAEYLDPECRTTLCAYLGQTGATVLAVDRSRMLGLNYSDRLFLR
ncbi:MAG: ABC transporter ATP-binding protein [Pseudomonadota bacterium]